jgi:Zn-dependent protease
MALALGLAAAVLVRRASVVAHELAHYAVARLLGYPAAVHLTGAHPHVAVRGIETVPHHACIVRHAGWIFSVLLAVLMSLAAFCMVGADALLVCVPSVIAAWATALDAVTSDLLGVARGSKRSQLGPCPPASQSSKRTGVVAHPVHVRSPRSALLLRQLRGAAA